MKKINFIWVSAAAVMLLLAGAVVAGEFYQYTDKDGNMIFTDDLNRVPREKQEEVKTIPSVVSKPQPPPGGQAGSPAAEQEPVPSESPEVNSEDQAPPPEEYVESGGEEGQPDMEEDSQETEPVDEASVEDPTEEESADKEAASESSESEGSSESSEVSDYEYMTGRFDSEKQELDEKLDRLQQEKEAIEKEDISEMSDMELNAHEEKVKALNARIKAQQKEQARFQERVNGFNQRVRKK